MPFLKAPGAKLHVQRIGEGPPLVMLHGLLIGSMASWYFTLAPALARHAQVILYDLRGHGRSQRVKSGYDSATMVGDLEAVADSVPGPLTLVGHSYGAIVALKYTLKHPHRVRRLALVEAPLPPASVGDVEQFLKSTPEEMLEVLPSQTGDTLKSGGRSARRLLKRLHFLATKTTVIEDLQAESDIDDALLSTVSCPVLAVYGLNSACVEVGHRLSRVIPDASLTLLEGGHWLHLDATEELGRVLAAFCRG